MTNGNKFIPIQLKKKIANKKMKKEKDKELLKKIIPTISRPDGKDREWFNNDEILSKLNKEELKIVEHGLIKMLKTDNSIYTFFP